MIQYGALRKHVSYCADQVSGLQCILIKFTFDHDPCKLLANVLTSCFVYSVVYHTVIHVMILHDAVELLLQPRFNCLSGELHLMRAWGIVYDVFAESGGSTWQTCFAKVFELLIVLYSAQVFGRVTYRIVIMILGPSSGCRLLNALLVVRCCQHFAPDMP